MQSDHRRRGSGDVETRAIYRFRTSVPSLDTRQRHRLKYESTRKDWRQRTLGLWILCSPLLSSWFDLRVSPMSTQVYMDSERNGFKRPLDLESTSSFCRHVNIVCTVFASHSLRGHLTSLLGQSKCIKQNYPSQIHGKGDSKLGIKFCSVFFIHSSNRWLVSTSSVGNFEWYVSNLRAREQIIEWCRSCQIVSKCRNPINSSRRQVLTRKSS